MRKLSEDGIALLTEWEGGARLKPYDDQTEKEISVWCPGATIGVGHLITQAEWGKYKDGMTIEDALQLLGQDVFPAETAVSTSIHVDQSQNQFDACVCLAFNIGGDAFQNSSVAKLINNPSAMTPFGNLESAWKAWNKSQGKVMEGLNVRRQNEWELYNS